MNANRLINMVLRLVMRKAMNKGMKAAGGKSNAQLKGLNKAARMARRAGRF